MLANVIRTGTTRGLDFVTLSELKRRAGVTEKQVVIWVLSELLANALDKDATTIRAGTRSEDGFIIVCVSDNGMRKITLDDLQLILNFENKASSKRGILRVSRGMLGNALKTIFGFSYALNKTEHPTILVECQETVFEIQLLPDLVNEKIEYEIKTNQRIDDGFTKIQVKLFAEVTPEEVKDFLDATTFVNPDRRFEFDVFGSVETIEPRRKNLIKLRNETSAIWYTLDQFIELFKEFRKASPESRLREFMALFRGFSGLEAMTEACKNAQHEKATVMIADGSDCAFLPSTKLKDVADEMTKSLYRAMKSKSEVISTRSIPSVLGCVGRESFRQLALRKGWELRSYRWAAGIKVQCNEYHDGDVKGPCKSRNDHVEFPLCFELAVFYRLDNDGLRVYPCLNFASSVEKNLFDRHYDIAAHVASSGRGIRSPLTVVAHVITPVVGWLNYGKTAMA